MDKYVNLFTDFGFKRVFGEEPNKDLLISFLNTLLPAQHQIAELEFNRTEWFGNTPIDRKAIFDLYCKTPDGTAFLVELQKAKQNFFKDRSVFYASFPIQEQGQRGEWDFRLSAVYTIGILDFIFDDADKDEVVHRVQLKDQKNQVFYDKRTFIYLTLPNFKKTLPELHTLQDKWLYILRYLPDLDGSPQLWPEQVFQKLFHVAELLAFKPQERKAYESSLKYYRDMRNVTNTAYQDGVLQGIAQGIEQGMAQGIEQGMAQGIEQGIAQGIEQERQRTRQKLLETAQNLKQLGVADANIAKATGLSLDEIATL